MAPAPTPKAGGNAITKKYGPLPGWAWVGLGVLGYYIYKQRKAAAAAAAGTSTAATTATDSTAADSTAATSPLAQAPTGYGYQGPGTSGYSGGGGPGWNVGTATGTTGGTTAPQVTSPAAALPSSPNTLPQDTAPSTTLQGSGYTSPGLVTGAGGTGYEGVPTPQAAQGILQSGGSLYYMSSPGVFTPTTGAGLAPNTELFQRTGS
jgi:hypothetical protein